MKLLLYSAFWCPDCRVAKRFLQERRVAFTEIDIENTPGAAEEGLLAPANAPSLNLSLTVNGSSPTARARAFSMKKCPNAWVSESLKTTRT